MKIASSGLDPESWITGGLVSIRAQFIVHRHGRGWLHLALFAIFFFLSISLSGFFSGVALCAFWKIIFWIYLFGKMLPQVDVKFSWRSNIIAWLVQITENAADRVSSGIRQLLQLPKRQAAFTIGFNPDYADSKYFKFGMHELHLPYNLLCWCMFVAFVYIQLQSVNSLDVNPIFEESGFISRCSMVINACLAMGVGLAVAVGPMFWFYWRLMKCGIAAKAEQESKLEELELPDANPMTDVHEEGLRHAAELESQRIRLVADLRTLEKQQTWPWSDRGFRVAFSVWLVFLVVPQTFLVLSMLPIPVLKRDEVQNAAQPARIVRAIVWQHEAKVHHLLDDSSSDR